MVSMIRADLLKTRKRWLAWALLAISLVLITLVMIMLMTQNGGTNGQFAPTGFPAGLLIGPQIIDESLGSFMAIILGASLVGSEYSYDTWKYLLIRHPGRVSFMISKWVTLSLTVAIGMVLVALWSQMLGLVFGPTSGTNQSPGPGLVLLELAVRTLVLIVQGTIALLGAVALSSTVAGIITGICWLLLDGIATAVPFVPAVLKGYLFSPVKGHMLAHIHGQAAAADVVPSLLVAGAYLVVSLVLAGYIFQRRDITS